MAQDVSDMKVPGGKPVYVPDDRGVMAEASSLVYNDAPWTAQPDLQFVHPKLSHQVCCFGPKACTQPSHMAQI